MTSTPSPLHGRLRPSTSLAPLLACAFLALGLGACSSGGSGSGGGQVGQIGAEIAKPDGSLAFVDPNLGGKGSRLRIAATSWGRLVDVHDVDAMGATNAVPIFRDFVIDGTLEGGFGDPDYMLDTSPITLKTRLVVKRTKGAPDMGMGTFADLLDAAKNLEEIKPNNDDGTGVGIEMVARNACLVIRFDDVLQDNAQAVAKLSENIKVLTGYPPTLPFTGRMLFDPNHGTLINAEFHSSRVLIDLTISEAESADMPVPEPVNSVGLPASRLASEMASVSIRIPTVIDLGVGQFQVLANLAGNTLTLSENGPVDPLSSTRDVVRAMRAGRSDDPNNGFLADDADPRVVGGWPVSLDQVDFDPMGELGFDFRVNMTFSTQCQDTPDVGDVFSVGDRFLEITEIATAPDMSGVVLDVHARLESSTAESNPGTLVGQGSLLTLYDPASLVVPGCWMSFAPQAGTFPVTDVPVDAQALVRFSEPMDPESMSPFENFVLVRGDSTVETTGANIVVGDVRGSDSKNVFFFTPALNFAHAQDNAPYHLELAGATDLAGNPLANTLPEIDFTIDALANPVMNGGVVFRFHETDELDPMGPEDEPINEFRGQIFYNLDRGTIMPRPVAFSSHPVDRGNNIVGQMLATTTGTNTPLSPLGSKLQTVWRYADLDWDIRDETKYNVDVSGLYWSPFGGLVVADFFENFEICLAHSKQLPDEGCPNNNCPSSGLSGSPTPYGDSVLEDPMSPPKVVHPRTLGYAVNPVDRFTSDTGTVLMPYPWNRTGGPMTTFTWRDTAVLALGGPSSAGIPINLDTLGGGNSDGPVGSVGRPGQVQAFGLPLLMEFRCYPSNTGVGVNLFDTSFASLGSPAFRAFSTGGTNASGVSIEKNPDLELAPSGGFNPINGGQQTALDADGQLYIGQLDIVVRVSRAHTIWIDTGFVGPTYATPVFTPSALDFPSGTSVQFDYRGADDFSADAEDRPFDANEIDPLGEISTGAVTFANGVDTWTSTISDIDGARYFQLRISFFNNIDTQLNAELSGLGFAFTE